MNILLVDNEPYSLMSLEECVREVLPQANLHCFNNPTAALEFAKDNSCDIAFCDIEMPVMNGIEMAKMLREINQSTNIVFVTAYSQYAIDAFDVFASGYVLKPVFKEAVEKVLDNLRCPIKHNEDRLRVQCFGNFEIFYKNEILKFRYSQTKEVFAYLIDRKGASVNTAELCGILWEDMPDSISHRHQVRNLISDLKTTLKKYNLENVFQYKRNCFAINVEAVDCDFYRFVDGDTSVINHYNGEYMTQYSWAEMTLGNLFRQINS